jgi:DNA-3-methyladenine glycosylase II
MTGDTVLVWAEATERLRGDPAVGPLVERVGPVRLRPPRGEAFESLTAAIVYQQLAGKAALAIHGRVVSALGGAVTPERVLETPDAVLRGAGLSANKLAAIRDLAARTASGELELEGIAGLEDVQVVERLSRVRGVGPWTAQMFLIFDLHRPDVWPTGDLGVRNGLARILSLDASPSPRDMEWIGTGYRPWRSALAWYSWQAVRVLTPGGGPAPEG